MITPSWGTNGEIPDTLTPSELQALGGIHAICSRSLKAFCITFMPERFYAKFSHPHDVICDACDDDTQEKTNIESCRGIGKTSFVATAFPAREILYRLRRFIVYISSNESRAIEKTENLKRELVSNKRIRAMFPYIKTSDYKFGDMDEQFSKHAWVANGHTLVLPLGCLQPIRGVLFDHYRPDLIIADDVQSIKLLSNELIRDEQWNWFRGDVEKAVSPYKQQKKKILHIDTVKHQSAISVRLEGLPDWKTIKLPLCDENYNSLVPDLVSTEAIKEEVESHRAGGTLDVFYRELMCVASSGEASSFQVRHFRHYNETDETFQDNLKNVETVILIDPAKTANPRSADTAIVAVGIDIHRNALYVRDIVSDKLHLDEVYSTAFRMAEKLKARTIGIEVTGLNEYATFPLKNEMIRRKLWFNLVELHARRGQTDKGKAERVKSLIPLYRQGLIYHNAACCGALESQLLSFPTPKKWDMMDCLAYAVEVLDEGERFFLPVREDEDEDKIDKELEDAIRELDKQDKDEYQEIDDDDYSACDYMNGVEQFALF